MPTFTSPPDHAENCGTAARIESWRVVAQGTEGAPATADATIRVRANGVRVLASGEGASPVEALEDGLARALTEVAAAGCSIEGDDLHALRTRSGIPVPGATDGVPLHVEAVYEAAMLTRLAALLGPHEVDRFSFVRDRSGTARVELSVLGGPWQADRVAAKLRRVVGVLEVVVGGTPDHPGRDVR